MIVFVDGSPTRWWLVFPVLLNVPVLVSQRRQLLRVDEHGVTLVGFQTKQVAWDDVREVVVHPSPRSARAAAGWWGTSSPMDVMGHDDTRIPLTVVTWNRGCVKAARRAVIAHGRQRGIPVTRPASPPSPHA